MLPGEVVGGNVATCSGCGQVLELCVLRSAAGFYVGFACDVDGPYSRVSGYYSTREEARKVLESGAFGR